jgi:hypothetical protein
MALIVSESWKKKYQISEELKDYARLITLGSIKITPAKIALSNTGAAITTRAPVIDLRVKVIKKRIRTYDGKSIGLTIYEPKNIKEQKAPAILYVHGGGFMIREASHHHKVSRDYALGLRPNSSLSIIASPLAILFPIRSKIAIRDCCGSIETPADSASIKIGLHVAAIVREAVFRQPSPT